jgi:hypothetical protein
LEIGRIDEIGDEVSLRFRQAIIAQICFPMLVADDEDFRKKR